MGVLKERFIEQLTLRGYSQKTIKNYTGCVQHLAHFYKKPPVELTEKQVRDFFVFLNKDKKLAPASFNWTLIVVPSGFMRIRYFGFLANPL
jgi:site-specific recombinase XerD